MYHTEPIAYDPAHHMRHRSNTEILNIDTTVAPPEGSSGGSGSGSAGRHSLPVRPRPTPKKAQSMGPAAMDNILTYPHHQSVHGYQCECQSYSVSSLSAVSFTLSFSCLVAAVVIYAAKRDVSLLVVLLVFLAWQAKNRYSLCACG